MTNTKSNLESDNETITQQLKSVKASMDALKGTEVWASEAATNRHKQQLAALRSDCFLMGHSIL